MSWTPGPWAWSEGGVLRGQDDLDDRVVVARHRSWGKGGNAELIAIAPDMASAIMTMLPALDHYDELCSDGECCDSEYGCGCRSRWSGKLTKFRRLAQKLRAIQDGEA
jgi:hypothetical protein